MRRMVIGLAAVAAVAACEERHLRGVVGTPGGGGSATVQVAVVDDPAGAEPVLSSGARPTVSVRFAAALLRAGIAANVPDTGALFAQVPIDSAGGALVATTDSVPAGSYTTIRLTLLEATLAMPGAAPVDLLAGTPAPSVTRDVPRAVSEGELLTLRIDLNSDGWLVPNPTPGAGPEFLFTGATDFLTALALTLP